MLRLLAPVEEEHVLEQRRQRRIRLDALPIVDLREDLDVARQGEHGPGRLAEHETRDVVGLAARRRSRRGMPAAISASMRRNSSWCFSSSSVKRTSASSADLVAERSARG